MNVANIIEDGRLAGPQVRICTITPKLTKNISTTVFVPASNSKEFIQFCKKNSINLRIIPLTCITKNWKSLIQYLSLFIIEIFIIVYYLKKDKIDLVHVSGGSWQIKGVIAAKIANIKSIWHLNDTYMPNIILFIFKFLSTLTDGYIFASNASKKYYRPYLSSPKPSFIIPAPVDTEKFSPSSNSKTTKPGNLCIGTIANINPNKDIETFIRSYSIACKKIKNLRLVIVGPIYESQKKYFSNLITLCNRLDINLKCFIGGVNDVKSILEEIDVYVCTSKSESSPTAVWEAMSMKKPVISTNVGDVPLYINHDRNGFIVEVGDFKMIASRLIELMRNPHKIEKFGNISRNECLRKLDVKIIAEYYNEAYSKMTYLSA